MFLLQYPNRPVWSTPSFTDTHWKDILIIIADDKLLSRSLRDEVDIVLAQTIESLKIIIFS